ncbi:hypothetical protein [Rhizobium leguminosarum]|uniref:hypothetical protein n=1 Tax=Rhizobium leguminosarum TaxID=384 RepID=UPI002E133B72|nr:hypothetical protein U8Q02_40120 [Rhizobium leguminosarum]
MADRIYRLLTGHYVDLAAIVELRSGQRGGPGSDFTFGIQYELRNEPVWFSIGFMNCLDIALQHPTVFAGLEKGLLAGDNDSAASVCQIVQDDLVRAWREHKGTAGEAVDPIFRSADGTSIDLSEILDVSAPALLEEDVYGFSILYKGQAERRVFSYNCYDTATADLLGLDFEAALASPHADAADRVALDVLATHVDALVDAWRKFKLAA